MFELSFGELLLIFLVVLIVVGPERMPELARKAGYWLGRTRRFIQSVQRDVERELRTDELQRLLNQQHDEIQQLKQMLTDTRVETEKSLKEAEHLVKALPGDKSEPASEQGTAPVADKPAGPRPE